MHFTAKIRPKNSPILMKLGIYNQHTSNQKRTKFYWNRTIIDSKFFRFSKKARLKISILSNFNCHMTILNDSRHHSLGSFCYPYNHSSLTVTIELISRNIFLWKKIIRFSTLCTIKSLFYVRCRLHSILFKNFFW